MFMNDWGDTKEEWYFEPGSFQAQKSVMTSSGFLALALILQQTFDYRPKSIANHYTTETWQYMKHE
jgi:hypothetical protein